MAVPRGERFRAHHARMCEGRHALRTVLAIGCGLLLLALGLIMLILPGPGVLTGLVGAALIAGESAFAARLLDRIDLHAAHVWARWRR
ncbi:MAG: hypothetical protein KGI64_01890 [Xanthomonadaceae bacterium]|nr:hypothetical protein [Xanthomonadaceae bacterium]MDE1960669.1 hypothetical protein [Xanthomonadaceae bacterium]MDE2083593.1 hypothetical protein [Xanthomonadaceae bacterium]